jgi:hypothetical protein
MVDDGARVLLSVLFELLLEFVDEDGETACSVSGRSNNEDGLVAGWPETSRRGKQEWRQCRARKQARLGNGHRGRVSLFIAQWNTTVIPTD